MALKTLHPSNIFYKDNIGIVRTTQEDCHGIAEHTPNGDVFVVCDGMGGHVGGQIASRIAVDSIIESLKKEQYANPLQALNEALQFANMKILDFASQQPELKGMGTTACVLLLQNDKAYIAHAGDSRIYLYLGKEKQLHRLTKDHSFVQTLIDAGEITNEEAEHHPNKNRIFKVLGIKPELQPTFNYRDLPILPKNGDVFLICSDGLSGMISDSTIKRVLSSNATIEQKGNSLITLALEGEKGQPGGQDNITVELIRIDNSPWKKTKFTSYNLQRKPKPQASISNSNVITIGRTRDNDIVIDGDNVSRNHLQIIQDGNGNCSVVDLGSTYGTFVNGQRITSEVRLQSNDVIQIGNTALPWQSYLKPFIRRKQKSKFKSKHIIWFVTAAIALGLLIAGSVVYFYVNSKAKKKIETQEQIITENELNEQNRQQKPTETENFKKQPEELNKQVTKTSNESNGKQANSTQKSSTKFAEEGKKYQNIEREHNEQKVNGEQDSSKNEIKGISNSQKPVADKEQTEQTIQKQNETLIQKTQTNKAESENTSEKVKESKPEKQMKTQKESFQDVYNKLTKNFTESDYKTVCNKIYDKIIKENFDNIKAEGYKIKKGEQNAKEVLDKKFATASTEGEYQLIIQALTDYGKVKKISKQQTDTTKK